MHGWFVKARLNSTLDIVFNLFAYGGAERQAGAHTAGS
jgi:hypothetical protein